jgi:hypothetical protein
MRSASKACAATVEIAAISDPSSAETLRGRGGAPSIGRKTKSETLIAFAF